MQTLLKSVTAAILVVTTFGIYQPALAASCSTTGVDLANWYLTLPTGSQGHPDTVMQPQLGSYSSEYFKPSTDGITFKAPVDGVHTTNSKYPRSELREMQGTEHASWSNASGTHTLCVREAVTHLPVAKPQVVSAQLHGKSDDVFLIKLSGSSLAVNYADGKKQIVLDPDYKLGTVFTLQLVATKGHMRISYNGTQKADLSITESGLYWKAGSYCQSNTSKGDKPGAYCEVAIYDLAVEHR